MSLTHSLERGGGGGGGSVVVQWKAGTPSGLGLEHERLDPAKESYQSARLWDTFLLAVSCQDLTKFLIKLIRHLAYIFLHNKRTRCQLAHTPSLEAATLAI